MRTEEELALVAERKAKWPQRDADTARMKRIRDEWRLWWKSMAFMERRGLFEEYGAMARLWEDWPEDAVNVAEMRELLDAEARDVRERLEAAMPIGFFIPSWEQAQIINAWSPEYEPEERPQGYQSVGVFCARRIGKTCAAIIDTLLWIFPNDPGWPMFEPRTDHMGRTCRIFRRPKWETWQKTGRMQFPKAGECPKDACEIWHGVPDSSHWQTKVQRQYRQWFPPSYVAVIKQESQWLRDSIRTRWGHIIQCKSYESDTMAWSGHAVWRVNLDEGPPRNILDEAAARVTAGGYLHWSYTPAEARNLGDRARLAHAAYNGEFPLVGDKAKFFISFKLKDAPEHIVPKQKREDDLRRYAMLGERGRVAAEGGFHQSSPSVFRVFIDNRRTIVLPWSFAEIRKRFPDANWLRGFDEGIVHPSTCVWMARLRTGEMIAARNWRKTGLSIGDRVRSIVDMTGNRLVRWNGGDLNWSQKMDKEGNPVEKWTEEMSGMKIRATFADYHIFKRDPSRPFDGAHADNYRRLGLKMQRAATTGPAERCDRLNEMFMPDPTRRHLDQENNPGAKGHRLYVSADCAELIEELENLLFEQIRTGGRTGEFTGNVEDCNDDTIDALAYVTMAAPRWSDGVSGGASGPVIAPLLSQPQPQYA